MHDSPIHTANTATIPCTLTAIASGDRNSYRQYSLDRHPALRCGIALAETVINGWFDNSFDTTPFDKIGRPLVAPTIVPFHAQFPKSYRQHRPTPRDRHCGHRPAIAQAATVINGWFDNSFDATILIR